MAKLHLNLKFKYFDEIKAGLKPEEFREQTPYWIKRLVGRTYDGIVLKRAYPSASDTESILELPWRGYVAKMIVHPEFGAAPKAVFAIKVSDGKEMQC